MGFLIIDPLEQFSLINLYIAKTNFFYSINTINLIIGLNILFLLLIIGYTKHFSIISWYLLNINLFVSFLYNICKNNLNIKVQIFTPFLIYIFLFILLSNVTGMLPYSFTVTSHFSVTFFISLSFFIGLNIFGILKHGYLFFNLFLPESSPLLISPLLVIVEFISYFARVFSLAIRLFANMMAGHALMKILASFCWTFLNLLNLITFSIIFLIIFCVIGLEFLIAFLQAYVFFMLMVVYLNDLVFLGH